MKKQEGIVVRKRAVRRRIDKFIRIIKDELPRAIVRFIERYLYDNWKKIRNWIVKALRDAKHGTDWLWDKVLPFFGSLWESVVDAFRGTGHSLIDLFGNMWHVAVAFFKSLVKGFEFEIA